MYVNQINLKSQNYSLFSQNDKGKVQQKKHKKENKVSPSAL